jgi:kumamolisin
MLNSKRMAIKGTEHALIPGSRPIGPTEPHRLMEVSVLLKHRQTLSEPESDRREPARELTHNDFAKTYGADPAHVDKMKQFAQEHKLQVLERGDEVLRRTVTLAGTAAALEKAFSVELTEYEHPDGSYCGHTGMIQMPEDCASFVTGVFGLDDRAVARPHFRYRSTNREFGTRSVNISYTPMQLAKLYGFPQDANGQGQRIGVIELGGGYRMSDVRDYFQSHGLQAPCVKSVSVNQATNRPSTAQSADVQVMLDIEVAGAIAQDTTIVCYFAPNNARGFQDALSTAVHDQLNKPNVLCISWGNPEDYWTQQSMENFDQVAQEAGMLGITVIAACSDNGSSAGILDGRNHVTFPASCPDVLAVGGTRLVATNGAIEGETVWNQGQLAGATGGGYSSKFSRPHWQANVVQEQRRGLPDVAANADPETGYRILVDGQEEVVGGTSAAVPLWAGLIVLLNQKLNRHLGFVNPELYSLQRKGGFREITIGNNGAFTAGHGWNPCAGQGVPQGTALLQALGGVAASVHAQEKTKQQQKPERVPAATEK